MKKNLLYFILLALVIFVACNKDKGEDNDPKEPESVAVESVSLNKNEISIYVDQKDTIVATVSPDNSTDKAVTWTSSDTDIVIVDENGIITGIATGTAAITAVASNGLSTTGNVTVNASPQMKIIIGGEAIRLQINIAFTGTAIVDWGDSIQKDEYPQLINTFKRDYDDSSDSRVVTITGNNITELEVACFWGTIDVDISKNPALKSLNCSGNYVTSLNIRKNTALTHLRCVNCSLTSLDLTENPALKEVSCYHNKLRSLDLTGNPDLIAVDCYNTELTSLDLSKNTELEYLYCGLNHLTDLDLSKNTKLKYISIEDNQITDLDVTNNTSLKTILCFSNKMTIDALNRLFHSLHRNIIPNEPKYIGYVGNPGAKDCNIEIATAKGWEVW